MLLVAASRGELPDRVRDKACPLAALVPSAPRGSGPKERAGGAREAEQRLTAPGGDTTTARGSALQEVAKRRGADAITAAHTAKERKKARSMAFIASAGQ